MNTTSILQVTDEQVAARVKTLPPLPQVWHALDDALRSDTASPDHIVRLVACDPGLTAVTLKLANSPFYGASGRVVSLRDAVQILGVQTLSAATMTASVMARFDPAACPAFDIASSWRHALGTAVCAQFLAEPRGIDPCAAYTAGLLHDIGTLALATSFPDVFNETLAWAARHDVPPIDAERELLGIDHAVVGGMVARHWRLAPAIADAVRQHHDVPDGPSASLNDVLHISDNIVHALDVSHAADDFVPPLDIGAWARVAPTTEELGRAFECVELHLMNLDLGASR